MNTIVVSSNKINNDIIPRLSIATNDLQTAYSMSINLKKTLSFNVKENYMSEISSELYNISKELKNITLNISDKLNRIEQIEKKSESKISSIVSKAASIGAITGAATSTLGMQAVIAQQSNKSVSTTDSKMSEIGAKLASEIESKTKNIGTAISNQVERMGAAISKGEVGFATETSNKLEDESNRSDGFKDWTSKALKNTGAFICNTGTKIWNGLKSAWNWITDGENWKRLGASIVNGVLSFVKGLVSLIEAIGDLVVLALGAVVTVGTAIYDTVKGIATGDWSFDATKGLWKKYAVPIVAYSWTNALDESLGWRQHFDQWAYEPFKSDGVGCQILDGVGYVAGIIALTLATFGVGGAAVSAASGAASTATAVTGAAVATGATSTAITAGVTSTTMAITAGAAGIGKGTQEAWQQQIEQANKQQITQELDNIQITEEMFNNKLSELKSQNPENEYTQEDVINAIRSDLYVERTKDLNSWNNIKSGAEKLKGSDIAAGVAYGVGTGVIDGIQWYAGGKINNLFKGANSVVANKFLSSLARVGLDSADAAAEVPLRTLMQSLYRTDENGNKMGFSDVWNENGGWNQVAVQAGVGALGSGIGEGLDAIKGAIATKKLTTLVSQTGENVDKQISKKLSKLSDIDVKKFTDKLDDSSRIAILKNMDGARFADYSNVLSSEETSKVIRNMNDANRIKTLVSLESARAKTLIDDLSSNTSAQIASSTQGSGIVSTGNVKAKKFIDLAEDDIIAQLDYEKSILDINDPEFISKSALLDQKKKLELELHNKLDELSGQNVSMKSVDLLSENQKIEVTQAAQEVYDNAVQHEKFITAQMQKLAGDDAYLEGLDFRVKSYDSIEDKISRKVLKYGSTAEMAKLDINDSLRYTLIVDDATYESQVLSRLAKLKNQGYSIVDINNSWGNLGSPTYQGLNVTLKTQDGLLTELQFHTASSFNVKQTLNHDFYEISRNAASSLEVKKLSDEIQKINQKVFAGTVNFKYQSAGELSKAVANYRDVLSSIGNFNVAPDGKKYQSYADFLNDSQANIDAWDQEASKNPNLKKNLIHYKGEGLEPGSYKIANGYLRGTLFDDATQTVKYVDTFGTPISLSYDEFEKNFHFSVSEYKSKIEDSIDILSSGISKCHLKTDTKLARGVYWDWLSTYGVEVGDSAETIFEKIKNSPSGAIFTEKGFMSTAPLLDENQLPWITQSKPVRLIMDVESGIGARVFPYDGEKEVLLNCGQSFKIYDVKKEIIDGSEKVLIYMRHILDK